MAIKKLTHTGRELDDVVQLYKNGYKNISRADIKPIQLRTGKIAINNLGTKIYGESAEYSGATTFAPSTEEQVIPKSTYVSSDITIQHIDLQEKTVDSAQIVTPDEGKYLSKVIITGMGSDYIGPEYETVESKDYTPHTMNITLVGPKIFSGAQIVLGDPDLVPGNIGNGIDIFGVVGTFAGDTVVEIPDNGEKWTNCVVGTKNPLLSFGSGKYVAICNNSNLAFYSTNGINWMQTTMPEECYWSGICYGNGKFVAISSNSTTAAYSTNGIVWSKSESYTTVNWKSVAYGNGLYVAVAANTDIAQYSKDGINWLYSAISKQANWSDVIFADNKFIAYSSDSKLIAISYNGTDWTNFTTEFVIDKVIVGCGVYIGFHKGSNTVFYSFDGINWSATLVQDETTETFNAWTDGVYANGKFILVAENNIMAESEDGITWRLIKVDCGSSNSIIHGGNKYVLGTSGVTSSIYYSKTSLEGDE